MRPKKKSEKNFRDFFFGQGLRRNGIMSTGEKAQKALGTRILKAMTSGPLKALKQILGRNWETG
jgi:hypothetical protein